jgi:hypothetical protein
VISGRCFHLTKLRIALRAVNDNGELFTLALVVFVCSAAGRVLHRRQCHGSGGRWLIRAAYSSPRVSFLVVVGNFAVGTEALLGFLTPEKPIAGMRHDFLIPFRIDKHALPPEKIAAVIVDVGDAGPFHK